MDVETATLAGLLIVVVGVLLGLERSYVNDRLVLKQRSEGELVEAERNANVAISRVERLEQNWKSHTHTNLEEAIVRLNAATPSANLVPVTSVTTSRKP